MKYIRTDKGFSIFFFIGIFTHSGLTFKRLKEENAKSLTVEQKSCLTASQKSLSPNLETGVSPSNP